MCLRHISKSASHSSKEPCGGCGIQNLPLNLECSLLFTSLRTLSYFFLCFAPIWQANWLSLFGCGLGLSKSAWQPLSFCKLSNFLFYLDALSEDTLLTVSALPGVSRKLILGSSLSHQNIFHEDCWGLLGFSESSICIPDLQCCHLVLCSYIFQVLPGEHIGFSLCELELQGGSGCWINILWVCWQFYVVLLPTPHFYCLGPAHGL